VFDLAGTQSNPASCCNFQKVGGGVSINPIDTLSIIVNDSTSTVNVDNIALGSVTEVPEPTSIGILATGLALFGLWRRRASGTPLRDARRFATCSALSPRDDAA